MGFDQADMPEDMELEDWIPVIEPLEKSEAFSDENMVYRLNEGAFENAAGMEVPYDGGENDTIYDMEETDGRFWFHWGPVHAEDGLMLKGDLASVENHGGEAVAETEAEIAGQYSAPYITEVLQEDGRGLVDVRLPTDYDQEDWEETVDTLVEISAEIGQYHEDLEEVSEQYRQ